MFPDTICYKNPCSNPGFKAKKNLTLKLWEIRLIRNSSYPPILNVCLKKSFIIPIRMMTFELRGDSVVLSHKQGVNNNQVDLFVNSEVSRKITIVIVTFTCLASFDVTRTRSITCWKIIA